VTVLHGVGPERAAQLANLGIHTVNDLLLHRPRRYEDRRQLRAISDLAVGEPAITRGRVVALGVKWFARHTKSIFELVLEDGPARLYCRWWNLPYMEKYFARGDEVVVFGRVRSLKPRVMDHPESEIVDSGEESSIHLGRITPIYPLTEGLPQRWLRALLWRTLAACEPQIPEPYPALQLAQTPDHPGVTAFPTRARALRGVHFPESMEHAEACRRRLALDEFLELQIEVTGRYATSAPAFRV